MEFIPAKESRFLITFFYWYTRFLFKLRFRRVNVQKKYQPKKGAKTVYYLNHNYWWDGIIPLYLAKKHFKQHARAIMDINQMQKHAFFSKIGAFSIDIDNPRSAISTLKYASNSLKQDDACLFIYPESKIVPVSDQTHEFKDGLSWLYQHADNVEFVPIAIHIDYTLGNRPDLHISIGSKIQIEKDLKRGELTKVFKNQLDELLSNLRKQIYQVHS